MRSRLRLWTALLMLAAGAAAAQETEAERKGYAIMLRNYEQMTTTNFRSDVNMQLIDRGGKIQTRHVKRISQTDDQDNESYHIRFLDPATVRDTTLLIIEQTDRDDDVWFYLPAIKKVRRISGATMRSPYMGTEFSYKDIKREKVKKKGTAYSFVKEEKLDGVDHDVLDAFPISPEEKREQGYHHRRMWVRKDHALITRVDFYDEGKDFLKRLICSKMQEIGKSGKARYLNFEMTNRKGVRTVLQFEMMRINEEPVDEKYFTTAYLMRK